MKKSTLLLISLVLVGTSLLAQTKVNVTFQVDMSHETVLNNDVQVVIKNPWIWTALVDQGNGIWSATVELDVNATYPYTFVNGGQDNWSGEEPLPSPCNMNTPSAPERHVVVAESDIVLDVVVFGSCTSDPYWTNVTLSVDLRGRSDLHPDGGVWVYTAADWSDWADMSDEDGDSIYSASLKREPGSTLPYFFSYQTGADPNSDYTAETVPAGCANNDGVRELAVPDADTVLPVFAYEDCTGKNMVTYRVDLNAVTDMHDGGSVWVLFGDWLEYYYMEDPDGDKIYTYTLETVADTAIPYKFSYQNGPDEWTNYVVESVPAECANADGYRELSITKGYTLLPAVSYGSCDETPPPTMVDMTFSVDLRGISDMYADGGVWIYLSTDWEDWDTMLDDDGDSIYSVTVQKAAGSTLPFVFSYQTGPDDWTDYVTETVPGECANADGFREMTVPEMDTILPVFAYEDCTGKNMVTYRVDMNGISDIHPGGAVWVLFGDWVEYYYMEDPDGDNIYSITLETVADTVIPYAYSYQNGPDEWSNYVVEAVPEECANADGYRELTITGGYIVLEPVAFGSCDATPPVTVNITFSVDMSNETVENNDVQVVIKEPVWIWTALADQGNGIWSATVEVLANETHSYTFVNGGENNWGGEEKLPDECNFGTPSAPERHVTVAKKDTILDLVAFGSCDENPVGQVNVTFSVDMSMETVSAEGVQLVIKGPWIWTALTDNGDGIWETTLLLNVNSTYPYTFVNGAKDDWSGEESVPEECNYGTASAPERRLMLAANDTVLTTVSFGACAVLSDVNVTFRVDMKDETVSGDGVQVVLKEPWLWTGLSDAGNGIWEATIVLTGNTGYPYSFVNGAKDYWAGEEVIVGDCKDGENNQRIADIGGADTILPAYIFGTCAPRGNDIPMEENQSFRVYPNPASDMLYIEMDKQYFHTVSLVDITGRLVRTMNTNFVGEISMDVNGLREGLYMLVLTGEEGQAVTRIAINR